MANDNKRKVIDRRKIERRAPRRGVNVRVDDPPNKVYKRVSYGQRT